MFNNEIKYAPWFARREKNVFQTPCAPWGAYALTHRDKLWGVNIIKVSALCGKLPIDIIKGFPRNPSKHTKKKYTPPLNKLLWKTFRFLPIPCLPPWGGAYTNAPNQTFAGVNIIKASACGRLQFIYNLKLSPPGERLPISSLHFL